MSKLCFIIDDSILTRHVGVRRYILSLYKSSMPNASLFKVEYTLDTYNPYFTELFINDSLIDGNLFSNSRLLATSKADSITNLGYAYMHSENNCEETNISSLACDTNVIEKFDSIIWGAPWIYKGLQVKTSTFKKSFCIAYDVIPNYYALNNPNNLSLNIFAFEHMRCYQDFIKHSAGLLSISSMTTKSLETFFYKEKSKIFTIPPFIPAGYLNCIKEKKTSDVAITHKKILLASPLDIRKGLDVIPKYLNALDYDELIIFGSPRSSYEVIYEFFNQLKNDKIIWWQEASYNKQVELYQEASLVLFPSHHEGLGLPVIEAQCCGTPVFVSNIEPLIELVDEYYILSDDFDSDIQKLQKVIDENKRIKSIYFKSNVLQNIINAELQKDFL